MKKALKIFILLIIFIGFAGIAQNATAGDETVSPLIKQQQDVLTELGAGGYGTAQTTQDAQNSLANKIGSAAGIVLSFLGVIFLFYIVYAGIQWMTAGGNEQQVENARERIVRAAIGMVIVASAWGISSFIIKKIQKNGEGATNIEQQCNALEQRQPCELNNLCKWAQINNEWKCTKK